MQQSLEEVVRDLRFKSPKSAKGRRCIPLPQFALDELRRFREQQQRLRDIAGEAYHGHNLICCMHDGAPLSPANFTTSFRDAMKRRHLPRIRFHDLRHAHASWLLRLGVHAKVVSERLGHSTVGITLDRYSHILPGLQAEAARKLDLALAGSGSVALWLDAFSTDVVGLSRARSKRATIASA